MIATRTTRRRGGFTLIELMVVVALIAILAALAAGTFFRIQAAELQRASEATLVKLHTHLNVRWTPVLEDAKKTVPPEVLALAGNDKDRAIAIWTYAKLQNEFPESFDEVRVTTPAVAPRVINLNGAVLPPKKVFYDLAVKTYTPAPTTDEQAAALFYAAINATSVGGLSPASDGLNNQTVTTASGLTMYKDAWGTPITFRRWAKLPEMQSAPYLHATQVPWSRAALASGQSGTFAVKNPLDPAGRLVARNLPAPGYPADNPFADPTNPLYANRLACLAQSPGTNPYGINLPDFTNENFGPTLVSFGPGKKSGEVAPEFQPFPTTTSPAVNDDMADNILSFRLRREGNRGD